MTTPRTRSLVSIASALTIILALGGCASNPSQHAGRRPAHAEGSAFVFRFDNAARDYVHVYLIGERREWLLGRVEPGARTMLQIPEAALTEHEGSVRLAVLAGGRTTYRAADDARAVITIKQPATEFLTQRWTFSQTLTTGQLVALPIGRARVVDRQ